MDIKKLEKLTKIELNENERENIMFSLYSLSEHMKNLDGVDSYPDEEQALQEKNVLRGDSVQPSLTREEILKNAAETQDGYIAVPPSFEKGEGI
jgi:aspartyl/glutamyl-tRNA(Asn/Gln) amidotransferase C subunit